MLKNNFKILLLIFWGCLSANSFLIAQQNEFGKFWNQERIFGKLLLEGSYRSRETVLANGFTENPDLGNFIGEFSLNSISNIYHPNFITLNIAAQYNPGIKNEKFLVMPDRTETKNGEMIRITSQIFRERPFSFSLFSGYNHSFINREFASNVEMSKKESGANLYFTNKYVPVNASYLYSDWEQKESQTGRVFTNIKHRFVTEANKSFGKRSKNSLRYAFEDYTREYADINKINNVISEIKLANNFKFKEKEPSGVNSNIIYYKQTGSTEFTRLTVNENLLAELPLNFRNITNYQLTVNDRAFYSSTRNHFTGKIQHQLFASLKTQLYFDYSANDRNDAFSEERKTIGIDLNYRKLIPIGSLYLKYNRKNSYDTRDSSPLLLTIDDEEHVLRDDAVTLLNNPYVEISSIVITDETGTIVYSPENDYIVIERDNIYVEIQRVGGGQIADGQTVYIDYVSTNQTSYSYNTVYNNFAAGIFLPGQIVELYYRYNGQDYNNIDMVNPDILRTVNRNVVGVKIRLNYVSAGFEKDNYNSNIIPYDAMKFYFSTDKSFINKIRGNITYNYRYLDYFDNGNIQKYSDISGRINYKINRNSSLLMHGGYRMQDGHGIDLNLTTMRGEYRYRWRKTYYVAGAEVYRRDFSGEKINYNGFYFRFERTF